MLHIINDCYGVITADNAKDDIYYEASQSATDNLGMAVACFVKQTFMV